MGQIVQIFPLYRLAMVLVGVAMSGCAAMADSPQQVLAQADTQVDTQVDPQGDTSPNTGTERTTQTQKLTITVTIASLYSVLPALAGPAPIIETPEPTPFLRASVPVLINLPRSGQ